jgi:decaprenylphospho-beta-D-ribofuranose 2-oxidase
VTLYGWGRYPRIEGRFLRARGPAEVLDVIRHEDSLIARGNGRAYGDAALNQRATLSMLPSNRLLAFDPDSGVLTSEAGVLLADIIDVFLPKGWFVPVTPGTKFVTLGGMIAADVHGKNHHNAGSVASHVLGLDLALADGEIVHCSPQENQELFAATCGGMGLTGVILSASVRMIPVETTSIRQETRRAGNLAEAMELFEQSQSWTYAAGWFDCLARGGRLGRSLIYLGEHARVAELPAGHAALRMSPKKTRRVPVDFPGFAINRWSVAAFNELYYRRGKPGTAFVDHNACFYPLDTILASNRIYGRSGFVQYQCVLPKATSQVGITTLLDRITRSGQGSFLAVLKLFGPGNDGMLSFPLEGYTLALDFPASPAVFSLLLELDAIVADHGGRLYLAKDARMGASMLTIGYPRLDAFRAVRRRIDPQGKFSSLLSQRLGL